MSATRAVESFYRFALFNVVSYTFLAGNIVTLYVLRFGASDILIGVVAGSYQAALFLGLLGRRLVSSFGAVQVFGRFWTLRYLFMIPVILTALPVFSEQPSLVLTVVTASVVLFNIAKGVAITGLRPIMGEIPSPGQRGAFLSNYQLIVHLGAISTGLAIALLLGPESSLVRYSVLLSLGVLAGLLASYYILRVPEPVQAGGGYAISIGDGLKRALESPPFRVLLSVNVLAGLSIFMANSFLVVYFKRVYSFGDGQIVYFAVAGSAGAAAMALFARRAMDRIGAKALMLLFACVFATNLLVLAVAPPVRGLTVWVVPTLLYFFFGMGQFGIINTIDAYFFEVTKAEDRLVSGIVFGLGTGSAGGAGGILGGILLSALTELFPARIVLPFSLYFVAAILVILPALVLVHRLPDIHEYRLPDALAMLFSPRELRAIFLVNRLERSTSEDEERTALRRLGGRRSSVAVSQLSERLSSPSLSVRLDAIRALRGNPLSRKAEDLLMQHLDQQPFTTAHLAAELLGEARVHRATHRLRRALRSPDYLTQANAAVALGRLMDLGSVPRLEALVLESHNPRVQAFAGHALAMIGSSRSLAIVLNAFRSTRNPAVETELLLIAARLAGIVNQFYPRFRTYLQDPAEAISALSSEISEFDAALAESLGSKERGPRQFADSAYERVSALLSAVPGAGPPAVLTRVALDLCDHPNPQLFFFLSVYLLSTYTNKEYGGVQNDQN